MTTPLSSVNSPPHYTASKIECVDAMEAMLHDWPLSAFSAAMANQTLKYLWRLGRKGPPLEDALKAQWYLNRLVQHLKETQPSEHTD